MLAVFFEKLLALMLERIKNESFSLLFCLAAAVFFLWQNYESRQRYDASILSLENRLSVCNTERENLSVRLAAVEATIEKSKSKRR